jgi:hypothetical protein
LPFKGSQPFGSLPRTIAKSGALRNKTVSFTPCLVSELAEKRQQNRSECMMLNS